MRDSGGEGGVCVGLCWYVFVCVCVFDYMCVHARFVWGVYVCFLASLSVSVCVYFNVFACPVSAGVYGYVHVLTYVCVSMSTCLCTCVDMYVCVSTSMCLC